MRERHHHGVILSFFGMHRELGRPASTTASSRSPARRGSFKRVWGRRRADIRAAPWAFAGFSKSRKSFHSGPACDVAWAGRLPGTVTHPQEVGCVTCHVSARVRGIDSCCHSCVLCRRRRPDVAAAIPSQYCCHPHRGASSPRRASDRGVLGPSPAGIGFHSA